VSAAFFLAGCGRVEVSVLTYNVAGLPQAFSSVQPETNTPLISPLLDAYDVVLVQEDFAYHAALAEHAHHPFQIPAFFAGGENLEIKNGLSRFSRFPIERHTARKWVQCHGIMDSLNDCLAPKGFSVAEHLIDLSRTTVAIDIYNLHMEAGDDPGDRDARAAQIEQLIEAIAERSSLRAIIVAGDTNIEDPSDPLFQRLLEGARLRDVCSELGCREPERIDRVLYRSSRWVEIQPVGWSTPDEFVDEDGNPLSDHLPVAVELAISATPVPEEALAHMQDFLDAMRQEQVLTTAE